MSAEDLEKYETEMELQLYREYRDVVGLFSHVVETERRFYLANDVDLKVRSADGEVFFDVTMTDAWVWDMYRPARFVKSVRVVTLNSADSQLGSSEAAAEIQSTDDMLSDEARARAGAVGKSYDSAAWDDSAMTPEGEFRDRGDNRRR